MPSRRALYIASLISTGAACKSADTCKTQPAAFQLDVVLTSAFQADTSAIKPLLVDLTLNGATFEQSFDVQNQLMDGSTSIAVDIAMAPMDAQPSDGPGDALPSDGQPDAQAMDAAPDASIHPDAAICFPLAVDPTFVAYYAFEGNTLDSTANHHDGTVHGTGVGYTPGPTGCSQAITFATAQSAYVEVAHAADLDLPQGSIDFWIEAPAPPLSQAEGVISRDSQTIIDGSLTVFVTCNGTLVAKLESGGTATYICSRFPLRQRWSYVGINFGGTSARPFEVFINGNAVSSTVTAGSVGLGGAGCTQTVPCGGYTTGGLTGNAQPFVFGASMEDADPGMDDNPSAFFTGALDELRISSVRRLFGDNGH
jgi:hypothetical protein